MKFSALPKITLLGLVLLLNSCGGGKTSPECGDSPITPSPDAFVVKINDQAMPNPNATDIPIQRITGTPINILLEYSINRTSSKCAGSYTGQLTTSFYQLPQGITADFNPTVIPASQGSPQILKISLNISSQVPDGIINLILQAPEVIPQFNPKYNILLTTKP